MSALILQSSQGEEEDEENVDIELVAFFNDNPSIEPFYSFFKQATFQSFANLSVEDLTTTLGTNIPNLDDVVKDIEECRKQITAQDEINQLLEATNNDATNDGDLIIETGLAMRLVSIKVKHLRSITSCIMKGLQLKCDSCNYNLSHEDHKLCKRLKCSSAVNIPQIKPFPIAEFELVVSDESFENMLKFNGVVSNDVKKEIGRVIYDYLRTIFP